MHARPLAYGTGEDAKFRAPSRCQRQHLAHRAWRDERGGFFQARFHCGCHDQMPLGFCWGPAPLPLFDSGCRGGHVAGPLTQKQVFSFSSSDDGSFHSQTGQVQGKAVQAQTLPRSFPVRTRHERCRLWPRWTGVHRGVREGMAAVAPEVAAAHSGALARNKSGKPFRETLCSSKDNPIRCAFVQRRSTLYVGVNVLAASSPSTLEEENPYCSYALGRFRNCGT